MPEDQQPLPPLPLPQNPETLRKVRKSARVVCASNKEFWTTQRQFWEWCREGIVTYVHDSPLTGKFEGRREKLIVMIKHILLDESVPDHKTHVLDAYQLQKPKRPKYPKRPVYKRAR